MRGTRHRRQAEQDESNKEEAGFKSDALQLGGGVLLLLSQVTAEWRIVTGN